MQNRNTLRGELGRSLVSGAGELELVGTMNGAILTDDHDEPDARRQALAVMAGALILHTGRLALDAFLTCRLRTGTRYARMDRILQEFILDLVRADPDPAADILRVQVLALRLLPAPAIRSAVTAMEHVAAAGAAPES